MILFYTGFSKGVRSPLPPFPCLSHWLQPINITKIPSLTRKGFREGNYSLVSFREVGKCSW